MGAIYNLAADVGYRKLMQGWNSSWKLMRLQFSCSCRL